MVVSQLSDDEDDDFGSTSYIFMNLFNGMLYVLMLLGGWVWSLWTQVAAQRSQCPMDFNE